MKIVTDILTNTFDAESNEKKVYYFEIANMESTKARLAKGEKVEIGTYEEEPEKKAGVFDWLSKYTSGGTDTKTEQNSQEKPPAIDDIQLESIDVGK